MKTTTLAVLLAATCLGFPAVAATQISARATPTGVEGIDASGELVWEIEHKSTSMDEETGEPDFPIRGPVEQDGTWFYAVRGDVLTLDADAGRVTGRTQYPAVVSRLHPTPEGLRVELEDTEWGEDVRISAAYVAGAKLGRGPWSSAGLALLRSRTDAPSALTSDGAFREHAGDWGEERDRLSALEARDPTNSLLPAYRGLAATLDGDTDDATAAFQKALATESPWTEDVMLCGIFERAQQPSLAEQACQRALKKMDERGIRRDAVASLVLQVLVSMDLVQAMEAAVVRNDAEAIDRIARRFDAIFPMSEASSLAWRRLSLWFQKGGDSARAEQWAQRAEEALESPFGRSFWGQSRKLDLMILVLFAIYIMVPLAGFSAGLRTVPDDERTGWRSWLPRPSRIEALFVVVVFLLTLPMTFFAMESTHQIEIYAEAPLGLLQDAYGSPDVIAWLDGAAGSEPRQEMLEYARHELAQVKAGQPVTQEPPSVGTLLETFEDFAAAKAWQTFLDFGAEFDDGPLEPSGIDFPNPLPFGLPVFLLYLMCGVVGTSVRRVSAHAAWPFQVVLPGSVTPFAPLLLVPFLVGLLALVTPIGGILQSMVVPAFGTYYGLGELNVEVPNLLVPSDVTTAWVLMLGALAVHAATLVWRR